MRLPKQLATDIPLQTHPFMTPTSQTDYILLALIATIIAILTITYRSTLNADKKLIVYILAILFPPAGLLMPILFKREHGRETESI